MRLILLDKLEILGNSSRVHFGGLDCFLWTCADWRWQSSGGGV